MGGTLEVCFKPLVQPWPPRNREGRGASHCPSASGPGDRASLAGPGRLPSATGRFCIAERGVLGGGHWRRAEQRECRAAARGVRLRCVPAWCSGVSDCERHAAAAIPLAGERRRRFVTRLPRRARAEWPRGPGGEQPWEHFNVPRTLHIRCRLAAHLSVASLTSGRRGQLEADADRTLRPNSISRAASSTMAHRYPPAHSNKTGIDISSAVNQRYELAAPSDLRVVDN